MVILQDIIDEVDYKMKYYSKRGDSGFVGELNHIRNLLDEFKEIKEDI